MKVFPQLKKRKAAFCVRAFTLVEVVMALAVVSFGLISMLGLLTVGMGTFRDAITATTEAEITQQIANQLQSAKFSNISTSPVSTYYYTQEGTPTIAGSAIYTATVGAPSKLTVPGGDAAASASTMTFVISITSVNTPATTNVTPIQISNNGF